MESKLLEKNKNLILIDTSYTLFHRFFATLRWLSLSNAEIYDKHKDDKDYNWLENKIFIEKYEKLYLEGIIKLVGKRVYKNSDIIFCMDTPKEQVWRTEIKSDYKADRFDLTKKCNFTPTFKYTYNIIIPNILKDPNIFKIRISKLEADDIIAVISKQLENHPDKKIYLISGDEDFYQLGRPNLFFLNFKTKKPFQITPEDAKYALHKKVLLGDKSDCIKSIFPNKFSKQIKTTLISSIEEFNKFLNNNDDIKKKYEENNKLINFDFIPSELKNIVIKEFNNLKIIL